jgi:MFS family permease
MGTFLLASIGNVRHKGRVLLVALALTAALMVAFSRSTSMGLALPLLTFFGGSLASFFTVSSASIQLIVPDRLRGRVSSLAAMSLGLMPVGGLLAGGLAEWMGAPSATLAAGALLAAVWLGLSLKLRLVWQFS